MKENRSSGGSGGVGFAGLLQVAFIVLKLCKVVDWSWWWVWSPTWIVTALVLVVLVVLAGMFAEDIFSK